MVAIFAIFTFFLGSCQEEISGDSTPSELLQQDRLMTEENSLKDYLASKVAMNIASSIGDPNVLDFMKKKADEKFDGDYNFLIERSKDESLGKIDDDSNKRLTTFGSVVSGFAPSDKRVLLQTNDFLDSLAKFHPLLQVFIPEFSEENHRIHGTDYLVAYVPRNMENNVIPAYDKSGNYYELSSINQPEVPVIVVSENERVTVISKDFKPNSKILTCPIIADAIYENDDYYYYNTKDVYDSQNLCVGDGGDGNIDGAPVDPSCDRDSNNSKDKLNRLKFNSMEDFRAINEWFDGGQEIEVTITFAKANGNLTKVKKFFTGADRDFKDCGVFNCDPVWFDLGDAEILSWDETIYGSAMLYVWIEKDPGNPIEISNSFTSTFPSTSGGPSTSITTSVKQTITDEDDELGEAIVEYCDMTTGEGYEYNATGARMRFNVRQ